jgi:hypothetical protein
VRENDHAAFARSLLLPPLPYFPEKIENFRQIFFAPLAICSSEPTKRPNRRCPVGSKVEGCRLDDFSGIMKDLAARVEDGDDGKIENRS